MMKSFISLLSYVALVHALPPITERDTPAVGSDCEFKDATAGTYPGTVTKTDGCTGGISFWLYGDNADVQCCVRASCDVKQSDTFSTYSCLNTYKKEQCGGGKGEFVAGHCIGDKTVQCCVTPQSSSSSKYDPTASGQGGSSDPYYQPVSSTQDPRLRGGYPGTSQGNPRYRGYPGTSQEDPRYRGYPVVQQPRPGDSVVVPTIESGNGLGSGSGGNEVVVPTYPGGNPKPEQVTSSDPNAVVVDTV